MVELSVNRQSVGVTKVDESRADKPRRVGGKEKGAYVCGDMHTQIPRKKQQCIRENQQQTNKKQQCIRENQQQTIKTYACHTIL